jgi:dolichol-phosphate mannosyltransferase
VVPQGSDVVVVIPTYQECDAILPLLSALRHALPEAHLLVVDDNSPDKTGERVTEFARADQHVSLIVRQHKAGIGPAYVEGFTAALQRSPKAILQMDADGSHDPNEAVRLISPILEGGADLVIGSRRVHGGSTVGWSNTRNLLSMFGSTYARILLRLMTSDATSGYRAWHPELLLQLMRETLRADGYGFQIEMAWRAQQLGARIEDAPITFREREVGSSKMHARIAVEAALLVLRLMADKYPKPQT